MMHSLCCNRTPVVTVLDNRGLPVRGIVYQRRPDTPDKTDERITQHRYDARGFLTQSADPRLHLTGQANFTWLTDLTGNPVHTVSADAGTSVALSDAAGRPLITISSIRTDGNGRHDVSQAVIHTFEYEDNDLTGRPLSITEQAHGETARITERFVYAGHSRPEKDLNLAGQCVSHYDTAGRMLTDSISLSGHPLSINRVLLKDADSADAVADWQGEDASAWNDLLDGQEHITLTTADATGAVLTTTDAKGNLQRVAYDVAGQLSGSWLTLKGGNEQIIVTSLTWSAAGQKLREVHGNGVVTTYEYEPETQRLSGIKTERPAGHASGAKVLQDLRYRYDPVGNVVSVKNSAEETTFWRNQKVVPENTYVYNSLYQLISASGREMANAGQQGDSLPGVSSFDNATYTCYTRTYSYDRAGNLLWIRHSAPATGNSYTTKITVSDRSNRGVLSTLTANPADVDALFTSAGQQKQLQPGQRLNWTPSGELLQVTPVVRDGTTGDQESYRYDGNSQRVLKISVQQTGGSTQIQRVLYLPGLELRTTAGGGTEKESLQVITLGEAGRAKVRVLHWESGQPAGMSNDPLRYSYDNLTGSSGLELDADGNVISLEEYYPFGGTAIWTARNTVEANYKTIRYSGKERDATGLYYYGYRYYQPWAGRWLSADPAGTVDGLNLYQMVSNNPTRYRDNNGLVKFDIANVDINLINGAIPFINTDLMKFDPSKNKYTKYKETYVTETLERHRYGMVSLDDAKSTLKTYAEKYDELNKKHSLDDNNMKLGKRISARITEGIASYEKNLLDSTSSRRGSNFSTYSFNGYNNQEVKYYALKDKNKKNIYAMAEVVVMSHYMHNRVAITIENLVSSPLIQLREEGVSFYEKNNLDSDFMIKGAGSRLVGKILQDLSQKHIIERIFTDAVNPRSEKIAKKLSTIATASNASSRLKKTWLTSVGKIRNSLPKKRSYINPGS